VGLSINDAATFASPVNVLDLGLKGSADGYAASVDNAGKFFVHYYTRDCTQLKAHVLPANRPGDCTEVDEQMVPKEGSANTVGDPTLSGMFWVGIRNYTLPGSARGPDTAGMLTPRILTFTRP
jgi:hypothetical protein